MVFDSVGLVLTDDCNARCKMCCAGKPELQEQHHTLTHQELTAVLSQIKEVRSITYVGITGGEPMMHPDLVQAVCDYDFGRPMRISLKTNGFWGRDPKKASSFLTRNSQQIKYISFSYDEFHCKYVDLNSIKTLIDLAWNKGIPTDIVGCFLKDSMSAGTVLDMLGEHAYRCNFLYQPVMRTGLATNFDEERFIRPYRFGKEKLPCSVALKHTLLINTALQVYPCCSQVVEGTILRIGDLTVEPLSKVISRTKHNKLLVSLFTKGLTPFLDVISDEADCPSEFSTPCEACEYLFRDTRFFNQFRNEVLN